MTFSIANAPSWANFDAATGKLSGTPSAAQVGTIRKDHHQCKRWNLERLAQCVHDHGDGPWRGRCTDHQRHTREYGDRRTGLQLSADREQPYGSALDVLHHQSSPLGEFRCRQRSFVWHPERRAGGQLSVHPHQRQRLAPRAPFCLHSASWSRRPQVRGQPTMSGSPATSVVVGNEYSFTPTQHGSERRASSPSASKTHRVGRAFNSATGELSGTPTAADVGTYSNITISLSDGTTSVSLPAFPIAVTENATGSVTLDWIAPTENTNGTPLTNLAGYMDLLRYQRQCPDEDHPDRQSRHRHLRDVQSVARNLVFRGERLHHRRCAEQSIGSGEQRPRLAMPLYGSPGVVRSGIYLDREGGRTVRDTPAASRTRVRHDSIAVYVRAVTMASRPP